MAGLGDQEIRDYFLAKEREVDALGFPVRPALRDMKENMAAAKAAKFEQKLARRRTSPHNKKRATTTEEIHLWPESKSMLSFHV